MNNYLLNTQYKEIFNIYDECLISDELFPVDINKLHKNIGYSRKDNFIAVLKKVSIQNVDYITKKQEYTYGMICGGRNKVDYFLSINCLKEILITQKTADSKLIRRYFILAEEVFRNNLKLNSIDLKNKLDEYNQYKVLIEKMKLEELSEKKEIYYQNILENKFKNELLSRNCLHGEIDIHLSNYIIEIKCWDNYKEALGQLLSYNYLNEKKMQVIFFGELPSNSIKNNIKNLFLQYNISVLYFDNHDTIKSL